MKDFIEKAKDNEFYLIFFISFAIILKNFSIPYRLSFIIYGWQLTFKRISPERILDVYVTVERYGAQIQDRGSAAHNIEGDPDVAEPQSEDPITKKIVDPGKGHHQPTDEEVGDGQGGQEEVADPPQPAVGINCHADQNVAGDGEEYEDHEEKSCGYRGSQENRRDTLLFNASPLEAP